jgi:uncharacterized protein YggE
MRNAVTVDGSGVVLVPPDHLMVSLSLTGKGPEVATALDAATAAITAVLAAVRDAGVADVDVRTQGLSVQESWGPNGTRTGYECSQSLHVALRDITAAGQVLRAVAAAGGDGLRVNDAHLDINDASGAAEQARAAAFADARAKALQYAALAKRQIGAVVSVVEGSSVRGMPVLRGKAFFASDAAAAPLPIAGGQLSVEATVQVKWALLD